MNRRVRIPLLALGLALTAVVALEAQAWKGRGRLHGVVTDEAGNPIEGATISLSPESDPDIGPEPLLTDEKGQWSFLGLRQGTWRIVIEKEGYIPSEGTSAVSEFSGGPPIRVELRPSPTASIGIGDRLLDEGRYAEARAEYEKAMSGLDPTAQSRLRSRIGDTYFQERNFSAALPYYQEALQALEAGEQLHVLLRLADAYRNLGELEQARSHYENTLAFLPPEEQARVLMSIAQTYGEQDPQKAIETLERALAQDPDNAPALQLIADLLIQTGREAEAETYLARIPADADLPPDMLLNIGIRLYNEADLDGALRNFDRVVAMQPDYPDSYYFRGLVHLGQGNNDLAAADLKRFLELAPQHDRAAEAKEFLTYLESGE